MPHPHTVLCRDGHREMAPVASCRMCLGNKLVQVVHTLIRTEKGYDILELQSQKSIHLAIHTDYYYTRLALPFYCNYDNLQHARNLMVCLPLRFSGLNNFSFHAIIQCFLNSLSRYELRQIKSIHWYDYDD